MELTPNNMKCIEQLSETITPPEISIHEAIKNIEKNNPDTFIYDNAVFLAIHKRICKETRENRIKIEENTVINENN